MLQTRELQQILGVPRAQTLSPTPPPPPTPTPVGAHTFWFLFSSSSFWEDQGAVLLSLADTMKAFLFSMQASLSHSHFYNFAFDTATYERTNRCKATDMSITYLDVTCAESGLESPPFSQMSSMGFVTLLSQRGT